MTRKIFFSIQLILVFYAVNAFATIYDYTVQGHFEVDYVTQYVSGNMQISDQFRVDTNGIYDDVYYFEITGFNLAVWGSESYNFSGDSGLLAYIHQLTIPETGEKIYERAWGISNSSGDYWSEGHGGVFFYTEEMTEYLPTSSDYYGILASTISLYGPSTASFYPTSSSGTGGGATWLTRNPESVPVPEPSTMLLLTGFLGPFFILARKRKNRIIRKMSTWNGDSWS